ncbi:MAG: hypothetical protein ACU0CO_05515 [Shimia sp.]
MNPPATRVLIHPGYHKTGTTSLQTWLATNRAALAPYVACYGKDALGPVGSTARLYGQRPFAWRLWAFRRALRAFLAGVPPGPILITRETLAGAMPGHRGPLGRPIHRYGPASRAMARVMRAEIDRRFPGAEIAFLYTLRDRAAWMESVHGHLLRSIRITETQGAFAVRPIPGPAAEAAAMARHLPCPVLTASLDDGAEALTRPIRTFFGVPDDLALAPIGHENQGQPPALRAAFARLNDDPPGDRPSDLRAAKAALLREAGDGRS